MSIWLLLRKCGAQGAETVRCAPNAAAPAHPVFLHFTHILHYKQLMYSLHILVSDHQLGLHSATGLGQTALVLPAA